MMAQSSDLQQEQQQQQQQQQLHSSMELLMDMEMELDMDMAMDMHDSEVYDHDDEKAHTNELVEHNEDAQLSLSKARHPLLLRCENALAMNISVSNDPSMRLTEEERNWALELRQLVLDSDEPLPFPLTDMEYVQYAMVAQGDLKEAARRIHGMQAFRQEYGVDETLEQAEIYFQEWFRHQPGFMLHLDTDPETFEPIVVIDLSAFVPGIATGHKQSKTPANTKHIIQRQLHQH
jgi:hypothetical protein